MQLTYTLDEVIYIYIWYVYDLRCRSWLIPIQLLPQGPFCPWWTRFFFDGFLVVGYPISPYKMKHPLRKSWLGNFHIIGIIWCFTVGMGVFPTVPWGVARFLPQPKYREFIVNVPGDAGFDPASLARVPRCDDHESCSDESYWQLFFRRPGEFTIFRNFLDLWGCAWQLNLIWRI